MPKLVSDLIIGNDWQTARRLPIMEAEEPEDIEIAVGKSTIIIENSANQISSVPDAENKSSAVPLVVMEDNTVVEQSAPVEVRSEVESEGRPAHPDQQYSEKCNSSGKSKVCGDCTRI